MNRLPSILAVLAFAGGVVGFLLSGWLLFVLVGFAGFAASLFLFGMSGPGMLGAPEDLQRADEHEEHPMPEGPAPPGLS